MKAKVTLTAVVFKRWLHRAVLVPKKLFGVTPAVMPLPVVVRLGPDAFESTLTSQDQDHYLLIVPVAYLRERDLDVGDSLRLSLEPDLARKAPELSEVMARYFRSEPARLALFRQQTIANQRQIVKYISSAASPASQLNRVEKMTDRLRELAQEKRKQRSSAAE